MNVISFDLSLHPLGESRDRADYTFVAAQCSVANPGIEQLFRVIAPCPVPPQTHTLTCPTEDSRMNDICGLLGRDLDARDMIESPQIIGNLKVKTWPLILRG